MRQGYQGNRRCRAVCLWSVCRSVELSFRCLQNSACEGVVQMCNGREFQIVGEATLKARLVRVRCILGIAKRWASEDLRVLLRLYGVRWSDRYKGWLQDRTECVMLATLYWILLVIGSQWWLAKISVCDVLLSWENEFNQRVLEAF